MPAIDHTENFELNDDWQEMFTGPVSIVLVSGKTFWAYNGSSPPPASTKLQDFVPLTCEGGEAAYSYGGTQKTYCRIGGLDSGVHPAQGRRVRTIISVTPII